MKKRRQKEPGPFANTNPAFFTPHQAERQNLLIRSSWKTLGSKEAVIAFLNTRNEKIAGQPLTLALGSDDDLKLVQRLLEDFDDSDTLR